MAVVVALGPVLYVADAPPVTVGHNFGEAETVILVPIKLFHNVNKLPILTQAVGHRTRSGSHCPHHFFQYLTRLAGDVLGVVQVAVDESVRNIGLGCKQPLALSLAYRALVAQGFHTLLVILESSVSIFSFNIIKSRQVAFFKVCATSFKCLVCERVIKQFSLGDDMLDVKILAEQPFTLYVRI